MITTINLNPCIDKTIWINGNEYGGTNQIERISFDYSGKGINTNIVLNNLGIYNQAILFDFSSKDSIKTFLDEKNIENHAVKVAGSLRENIKIFNSIDGVMTEYNERGSFINKSDINKINELIDAQIDKSDVVVVSGSIPPGVDVNIYKEIITKANKKNKYSVLDAKGDVFKEALKAKPYIIKPNIYEFEELLGKKLNSNEEIIQEAKKLIDDGICIVCISLGSKGAILCNKDKAFFAKPLQIDVKGVQGAGDSLVAGLCIGLVKNLSTQEILRYGVAIASGSLTHDGTMLCTKEDLDKYLDKIEIVEI